MPVLRNNLGHFLAQKPMRITPAKGYHRVKPQAVSPAVRWIRGPRPLQPFFVTNLMEMKCNACTWVTRDFGLWELKFVNRHCPYHEHLIGQRECLG